jgi:hypothetical protein
VAIIRQYENPAKDTIKGKREILRWTRISLFSPSEHSLLCVNLINIAAHIAGGAEEPRRKATG